MTNKEATKLTLPTTLHQARAKPIEAQGNVGFGQADGQTDRPRDGTELAAGQATGLVYGHGIGPERAVQTAPGFTRSFAHFFRFQFCRRFLRSFPSSPGMQETSHLFSLVLSLGVYVCVSCLPAIGRAEEIIFMP